MLYLGMFCVLRHCNKVEITYIAMEGNNIMVYFTLILRNKPDSTDIQVADFDGVLFHISSHSGDKTKLKVHILLRVFVCRQL